MGRLQTLKPRLQTAGARLSRLDDAPSGHREKTQAGAHWYNTSRWQKLRRAIWTRDHYTCIRCDLLSGAKGALVCDHRIPHRGDAALFWDPANLQTMCKACHDSAKQKEDRLWP